MTDPDERQISRRELLGAASAGALLLAGFDTGVGRAGTVARLAGPRRGGTFRLGVSDGSASESLDPSFGDYSYASQARCWALYDTLTEMDPNSYQVRNRLAQELTPARDLSSWTVRVREAEWHNGKPVTADDVIYSLRRSIDSKVASTGAQFLRAVDTKRLQKLDRRTVRIHLKYPDVDLRNAFWPAGNAIVPVGFDPKRPVGSGPFMFRSFTPGQRSVFVRNPNYWRNGKPYLDQLEIIDFADSGTTRLSALQSGQIDGADHVPSTLVPTLDGIRNLKVVVSNSRNFLTWEMRCDRPPFNDARVRLAMKLIADRPQMVTQAYGGSRFAAVGNDLAGIQDPMYNHAIPQRRQDIERAKALLKQAGRADLAVPLYITDFGPGIIESAQVLAQNARAAGVKIDVRKVEATTYWAKYAYQANFKFSYYNTYPILMGYTTFVLPTGNFNLTYWKNPKFIRLANQARATLNVARRKELLAEAQRIVWAESGQGVFTYARAINAYSKKFAGVGKDSWGEGLNSMHFEDIYAV